VAIGTPHAARIQPNCPAITVLVLILMRFVQEWYAFSYSNTEDKLYLMAIHRVFECRDHGGIATPDETAIVHCRPLIETHGLVH